MDDLPLTGYTATVQQSESLKRNRWQIAAILMVAIAVSAVGVFWLLASPVSSVAQTREFTVQPGWGGGRIASELQRAGLIRWAPVMIVIANFTDTGDSLKAGTYALSPGMSASEIVRILVSGDALSSDITVTIPEGMNVWEIDNLLAGQHLIVPGSFARAYSADEGKLFPDTYRFGASLAEHAGEYANARVIGAVLRGAFDAKARGYTHAQIIVASMLEKEAKSADDMVLVAGIIIERERRGMLLQIDATVAYGWCLARWLALSGVEGLPMSSNRTCDVTQAPIASEIKVDSPYNTYTRIGLPKGPISNPGLKALEAAAHPTASPYLYYLSTRDGSQLVYSKTLSEHLANRRKYLGL